MVAILIKWGLITRQQRILRHEKEMKKIYNELMKEK